MQAQKKIFVQQTHHLLGSGSGTAKKAGKNDSFTSTSDFFLEHICIAKISQGDMGSGTAENPDENVGSTSIERDGGGGELGAQSLQSAEQCDKFCPLPTLLALKPIAFRRKVWYSGRTIRDPVPIRRSGLNYEYVNKHCKTASAGGNFLRVNRITG